MPSTKKWVKLWVNECLNGSIRYQLAPDERSVWYDLILFAALGDPPGVIADRDGRPFPRSFIAGRLNISEALLESTIEDCKTEGRIIETDGVLLIAHWERYQSEYDRQRKYRDPDDELAGGVLWYRGLCLSANIDAVRFEKMSAIHQRYYRLYCAENNIPLPEGVEPDERKKGEHRETKKP